MKKLPEHWKATYCTFIAEGYTRNDAAKATGVAIGTVDRHQSEDPEFRELYVEAREAVRDQVRNKVWKLAMDPAIQVDEAGHVAIVDAQTMRWALDHLVKWNLPEAKEHQKLEVDVSGTVAIEDRSSSLHDVALVLAAVGALPRYSSRALSGEVPAARELLAESTES